MIRQPVEMVDVPCSNEVCNHLDRERQRCRVGVGVGAQGIKWIFALDACPLSKAYADLVAREAARSGRSVLDPRSKVSHAAQYRLAAMLVHERESALGLPGRSLLDDVVDAARGRRSPAAGEDEDRVAAILDTPIERPRTRRSPVLVAFAAVAIVLVLLLVTRGTRTADPERTTPLRVRPVVDPSRATAGESFSLEFFVERPVFVSIFFLPTKGTPERLFPPLAAPVGLPWPLEPAEVGPQRYRIPAVGSLRWPSSLPGWLVVLHHPEYAPDPIDTLMDVARTPSAIGRAFPEAIVLRAGEGR